MEKTVRFDPEIVELVKKKAKEHGMSLKEYIKYCCEEFEKSCKEKEED